ncbi:MAG: zinc-ribbon domain-containing protein [Gemmataceae bacterium]|nr:zinc-ribbon domain-containing protein [Gemmataceae bacterium]
MSSIIACPKCSRDMRVPAEAGGKKIRCPGCDAVFEAPVLAEVVDDASFGVTEKVAPPVHASPPKAGSSRPEGTSGPPPLRRRRRFDEDDEDDFDVRRRRRREETAGGMPLWLIIGLPVGGVVLIAMLVVGVALLNREAEQEFALMNAPPPNFPPIVQQKFEDFPPPVNFPNDPPPKFFPPDDFPPKPPPSPPPPAWKKIAPRAPAAGPTLTEVKTIALEANALAYNPADKHLYAAVASSAANNGNTITALDPATGDVVWYVNVSSDPAVLAMADNHKVLWVGPHGASGIQRIDLVARKAGPLLPFHVQRHGAVFAEDIAVLPGSADSVAVSMFSKGVSPRHAGVAIFDNGAPRAGKTQDHTGSNRIAASDQPEILFGYCNETTEFGLRHLYADGGGIREGRVAGGVIQGFGNDIVYAGGRIYSSNGAVVDAQNLNLVGTIPTQGALAVDAFNKRVYVLAGDQRGNLNAYDTETLTKRGSMSLANYPEIQGSLVQLGDSALAFRTKRQIVIVPLGQLK